MLSRGSGIIIVIILATNLLSLHLNVTVKEAVILLVPNLTADVEIYGVLNSLERNFQKASTFPG